MSTLIVVACLIVCFSSLTLGYEPYRKQLSGPPSEFELHRLPRPSMVIQEEQSAFIRFVLKPGFNRRELWVDGDTFAFSFMSPVSNVVKLRLWNPSEQRVSLKPSRQDAMFPVGGVNLKHDAFLFENPEKGRWILEMYLMQENTMEEAAIILWNESPLRMYSHLDTYNLHLHESIGVVSRVARLTEEVRQLLGSTMSGHSINADQDAMMIEARLDIVAPNGTEVDIVMMDDGQHGDLLANDGVYAGSIIAPEEGVYKVEATVRGRLGDGQSFQRSTQHLIAVVEDRVDFVGHAWMQTNSDLSYYSEDVPTADIFIQIDHQTSQPAILQKRRANGVNVNVEDDIKAFLRNKYRAYAEIWATDSDGNLQPACWISSMVNVDRIPANKHTDLLSYNAPVYAVRLQLDLRWLKRQGLSEPLTLRNAFITDAKTNIPLAEAEEIEVEPEEAVVLKTVLQKHPLLRSYQAESRITPLMRAGMPSEMRLEKRSKLASTLLSETVEGEHLAMDMNGKKDGGSRRSRSGGENRDEEGHNEEEYDENVVPTLLLTHGYCSEDNPWEGSKGYFSEAAYFVDILQSRTNDEFANMLFDFSEKNGMTHFGIIGHSQGGLASTHMKNYYFTGLDESQGDRVIQSVGSPYKGCRLAGTAALLGRMFGIGCGHNFDLSPDGAALWGSGITTDTRSKVYYYTTTASKGNYCNFASNLVLSKPNDGVTEVDLGTLDGGYYMGNANNECHTINMNYYAQYSNSKRNTEMNDQAAR